MVEEGIGQFTNKRGSRHALGHYISYEARVAEGIVREGPLQINPGDPCYLIHIKARDLKETVDPKKVFSALPGDFTKLASIISTEGFTDNGHVLGISTSMIGRIASRCGFDIVPVEVGEHYSDGTKAIYEYLKQGRNFNYEGMIACYLPARAFVEKFSVNRLADGENPHPPAAD